jgi:flagella basal body P-ring formation protein FlgA
MFARWSLLLFAFSRVSLGAPLDELHPKAQVLGFFSLKPRVLIHGGGDIRLQDIATLEDPLPGVETQKLMETRISWIPKNGVPLVLSQGAIEDHIETAWPGIQPRFLNPVDPVVYTKKTYLFQKDLKSKLAAILPDSVRVLALTEPRGVDVLDPAQPLVCVTPGEIIPPVLSLSKCSLGLGDFPLVARIKTLEKVPFLGRPLAKGEPLTEDHITYRFEDGPGVSVEPLLGLEAKQALAQGRALAAHLFAPKILIHQGDRVDLSYGSGSGLLLSSPAKALGRGALGDKILFQVLFSKKTIEAHITGPGKAQL